MTYAEFHDISKTIFTVIGCLTVIKIALQILIYSFYQLRSELQRDKASDGCDALQKLGFTKYDRGSMDVLYVRKLPYSWYEYEAIQFEHRDKRIKVDIKSNGGFLRDFEREAIRTIETELWEK